MKDPVLVQSNIPDKVKIAGENEFLTETTIGLVEGGDFYLELNFKDLAQNEFEALVRLSKLNHRLEFESDLVKREDYNITHIVVTDFNANSELNMYWICLSDDPTLYEL